MTASSAARGTSAFMLPRTIEAVLLLLDDDVHTFGDVASALEGLGIPPPVALVLTQETHDTGLSVVSKGAVAEMAYAATLLSAFNVSILRTSDVDAAVAETARGSPAAPPHSNVGPPGAAPDVGRRAPPR